MLVPRARAAAQTRPASRHGHGPSTKAIGPSRYWAELCSAVLVLARRAWPIWPPISVLSKRQVCAYHLPPQAWLPHRHTTSLVERPRRSDACSMLHAIVFSSDVICFICLISDVSPARCCADRCQGCYCTHFSCSMKCWSKL